MKKSEIIELTPAYICCDDCETEWTDPASATAYDRCDRCTRDQFGPSRFATPDDLRNHSWRPFIRNFPAE